MRAAGVGLALLLAACAGKITPENYAKIDHGMTRDQVYEILGFPDESSGAGIGALSFSTETWSGRKHTVTITFADDKVTLKGIRGTVDSTRATPAS